MSGTDKAGDAAAGAAVVPHQRFSCTLLYHLSHHLGDLCCVVFGQTGHVLRQVLHGQLHLGNLCCEVFCQGDHLVGEILDGRLYLVKPTLR